MYMYMCIAHYIAKENCRGRKKVKEGNPDLTNYTSKAQTKQTQNE